MIVSLEKTERPIPNEPPSVFKDLKKSAPCIFLLLMEITFPLRNFIFKVLDFFGY